MVRRSVVAVGIVVIGVGIVVIGVGIVVIGVGKGASAIAASGGSGSEHRPAQHPPVPRVSTLGATRSATLVSYCWTVRDAGGGGHGVCADGIPGHAAHTLHWRPGAKIGVDLGLPAHNVQVQTDRIDSTGGRPRHVVQLHVTRADSAGRRWTVHLTRRSERDTDLLIFATFHDGDVEADLGIHRG